LRVARPIAIPLALAVGLLVAMPAAASTGEAESFVSHAVIDRDPAPVTTYDASPAPCSDTLYRLAGGKWTKTLKWHFRASSTPSYLSRSSTQSVIARAFNNIVNARNDCGRSDRISATHAYQGTTTTKARCNYRDGKNVVGFKSLPSDVLARTCWWVSSGRIVEADIQINTNFRWALSLSGCSFQPMLEAVMTHEVGHAFGMGHVGEKNHGRLTMSTRLDGMCNNQESTLGLGDLLGLEQLY
jgi:hypothetical protein